MGEVQLPGIGVQLIAQVSLGPNTHRLPAVGPQLADVGVSLLFPEPEPPVPPGPLDREITALDGLTAYSTNYNSIFGNVIVRVVARNNAASASGMSVSWAGAPLTSCELIEEETVGGLIVAIFAIRGGATGVHALEITCSGSAGYAAVRIGDVAALDASFLGAHSGDFSFQYYWETVLNLQQPANSDVTVAAGSLLAEAYPITPDSDLYVEQWQTIMDDGTHRLVAWFGHVPTSPGYPYYLVYPNLYCFGGIVGVEFKGLVPPP